MNQFRDENSQSSSIIGEHLYEPNKYSHYDYDMMSPGSQSLSKGLHNYCENRYNQGQSSMLSRFQDFHEKCNDSSPSLLIKNRSEIDFERIKNNQSRNLLPKIKSEAILKLDKPSEVMTKMQYKKNLIPKLRKAIFQKTEMPAQYFEEYRNSVVESNQEYTAMKRTMEDEISNSPVYYG